MRKSMPGLPLVLPRSAGMWGERLLPITGIQPAPGACSGHNDCPDLAGERLA